MGDALYDDLAVGTQLRVQDVVKTQFVHAADCEVVARWVEGQRDQRVQGFVVQSVLFVFEAEHTEKLASRVFIVPNTDCIVESRTGCDEWAL